MDNNKQEQLEWAMWVLSAATIMTMMVFNFM